VTMLLIYLALTVVNRQKLRGNTHKQPLSSVLLILLTCLQPAQNHVKRVVGISLPFKNCAVSSQHLRSAGRFYNLDRTRI
jgi:hypothetical protein